MATTGIAADFARMPGSRKVLIIAVIAMLLGIVYYKFVYKGLDEDLDEEQATYDKNAKTLDRLEKTEMPECKERRLTYPKLEARLNTYVKALPTDAEVPAFFETIGQKATAAGVEINKWNRKPEEPIESFMRIPVEIEIAGTYMQLKRFFASLVQKPVRGDDEPERIVSIEQFTLAQPAVKNHEIVLTAKFTAVTYRQENKPPPPAPGAAPGTPGKPTAPAATPAPPTAPLPSAATPAGAKARVDNSMQKDQQRVDSAGSGSARLKGGL
jgi:type IV pilus assembly protein PilO